MYLRQIYIYNNKESRYVQIYIWNDIKKYILSCVT